MQALIGTLDLHLDRRLREAEHVRDFLVLVPDLFKLQNLAGPLWELRYRLLHIEPDILGVLVTWFGVYVYLVAFFSRSVSSTKKILKFKYGRAHGK